MNKIGIGKSTFSSTFASKLITMKYNNSFYSFRNYKAVIL